MKLTTGKLAAIGASAAMLAMLAGPAFGASNVDVLFNSSGGSRQLSLLQPDGTTPLTSTDLSSGASNFIAKVQDSSYSNNGFKVQATMSNLYSYDSTTKTYTCGSMVPSSAVSLSSPTGLLTVGGVTANLTPVFSVVGTLTSANISDLLLITPVAVNNTINGVLPTGQNPLSQSQLTGSTASNLVGSTLANVENLLPVSLGTTGLGGAFATPDVHPTCDTTATGATPVQMMNGTADPTGLLGDLQKLITSTAGSAAPTLTQLIANGYLTSSQVSTMLQGITSLVNQLGGLTQLTNDLPNIENVLTATITAVTTLPGSIVQSGTYTSSPDLAINTSGIPAGSYKGVMTVTLLDQ